MNPLVSIVIPVYNGANYLRHAIDSALAQSYENCEVIVVNDGSTDATDEICQSYGDRIRYFSKANGGVATAVNLGIENMRGEYFSWLSHDDMYYLDKVESEIAALSRMADKTMPVFGNFDCIDVPGKRFYGFSELNSHAQHNLSSGVYALFYELVNANTMLLHKMEFERFGMFDIDLKSTQDYALWFKVFRNRELCYMNRPVAITRFHPMQGTNTISNHDIARDDLHLNFGHHLTEFEMIEMFGSKYNFHYNVYQYHSKARMPKSAKWHKDELKKTAEPDDAGELRDRLKNVLSTDKGIVLLGAGNRGREINNELYARGIDIEGYVDNYSYEYSKPSSGLRDKMVIITPEDKEGEIRSQLIGLECSHWMTYSQLMRALRQIPPIKKHVLEFID